MTIFLKYKNELSYKEVLQGDGAFSAVHINYGKSPVFKKTAIKGSNIGSISNSLVVGVK